MRGEAPPASLVGSTTAGGKKRKVMTTKKREVSDDEIAMEKKSSSKKRSNIVSPSSNPRSPNTAGGSRSSSTSVTSSTSSSNRTRPTSLAVTASAVDDIDDGNESSTSVDADHSPRHSSRRNLLKKRNAALANMSVNASTALTSTPTTTNKSSTSGVATSGGSTPTPTMSATAAAAAQIAAARRRGGALAIPQQSSTPSASSRANTPLPAHLAPVTISPDGSIVPLNATPAAVLSGQDLQLMGMVQSVNGSYATATTPTPSGQPPPSPLSAALMATSDFLEFDRSTNQYKLRPSQLRAASAGGVDISRSPMPLAGADPSQPPGQYFIGIPSSSPPLSQCAQILRIPLYRKYGWYSHPIRSNHSNHGNDTQ